MAKGRHASALLVWAGSASNDCAEALFSRKAISHRSRGAGTGLDCTAGTAGPGPQGVPADPASAAAAAQGADRPGLIADPPAAAPSRRGSALARGVLGWPPAWMQWRRKSSGGGGGGGGTPMRKQRASENGSAGESEYEWDPLHEKVPPASKGCEKLTCLSE